MSEFSRFSRLTQLALEGLGQTVVDNEGDGLAALSAQEVRERSFAARADLDKQEMGEDWSEVFQRLINAGWTWRIAAYIAWASTPKVGRWPETQEKLATEVLGLTSDRQISRWRKQYPVIDQMIADLQAESLLDARADVLHALKSSASNPSYRNSSDRKLYLEMVGDYVPISKLVAELKKRGMDESDLEGMGEDELTEIVRQANAMLGEDDAE